MSVFFRHIVQHELIFVLYCMNDTRFDYTFGQLHKSPSKLNGINIKEQKRQNFIIHIIYWQRIFCIIYLLLYSFSLQEIGGNVSPQLPSSMQYLSSYYPPPGPCSDICLHNIVRVFTRRYSPLRLDVNVFCQCQVFQAFFSLCTQ